MKSRARAVLAAACSIHFVHDGFSDILYVLLPIWANEFRLTFAQVGIIRTAYSGGMAAFQIPAGLLAERWGERRLLAAGTAVTACGFIAAGIVGGFLSLLSVLLVAGLGSGVQHPLSSSLVSKAYETGPRRAALGTYNFSGDLGKVAVPAAVAFAALVVGWRTAVGGLWRDRPRGGGRDSRRARATHHRHVGARGRRPDEGASRGPVGLGDSRPARLSGADRDRNDRQRDAHRIPHVPAVRADREGLLRSRASARRWRCSSRAAPSASSPAAWSPSVSA